MKKLDVVGASAWGLKAGDYIFVAVDENIVLYKMVEASDGTLKCRVAYFYERWWVNVSGWVRRKLRTYL